MKRTPRLRTVLSLSFMLAAVVPLLVIGSLTLVLLTRHLTHEISTKNQALARTLTVRFQIRPASMRIWTVSCTISPISSRCRS